MCPPREDVQVNDVPFYFPKEITQFTGSNFLVGLRPSIAYDSRDSYLRPTQGSQLEFGYEQVFGDFTYPLFNVEAASTGRCGSGRMAAAGTSWQRDRKPHSPGTTRHL